MVGITTRVALTAYRTDEGRNAADFFHGQATDVIVNNDKVRKGLLIGAIVIFVPMAICAFFVEPSNKSEEYLPSDHPLQKIVTIMSNEFPPAQWDRMVKAEIVFGINPAMPLDRKGKNDLMDYERPPDYHNQESWQEHMEAAKLPENWPHQPETCCGVPCSTLPCSQTTPPTCEQPETCYVDSFVSANSRLACGARALTMPAVFSGLGQSGDAVVNAAGLQRGRQLVVRDTRPGPLVHAGPLQRGENHLRREGDDRVARPQLQRPGYPERRGR